MKNILIEHTRAPKMVHFFIKKFIPVFEQVYKEGYWRPNLVGEIKYARWGWNFDQPSPTSIPQKMWPILYARRKRVGQLRLV